MKAEEYSKNTTPDLERRVQDVMRGAGVTRVLAGVSGGADSVALLLALRSDPHMELTAVHCNFHLRGEESDRDMLFVEQLSGHLGVPLVTVHFDVPEYIRRNGVSVEMACRDLRYAEFRRIMSQVGAGRIAVAHNADDNAETLLLNLMRGAGVAGLRGMRPDTGEVIRPLLSMSRADIERYLDAKGQPFVTDSTNLSSDYRRNFLRNRVLPLLAEQWPEARKSICRSASNLLQEERVLRWAEETLGASQGDSLAFDTIRRSPDAGWLISRFVTRLGGSYTQAAEMERAIFADDFCSGKFWILPQGRISLERDHLRFIQDTPAECPAPTAECLMIGTSVMERVRNAPLSELWLPLPPDEVEFRHPAAGDRISPLGMAGSTRVSKILKDARLSAAEKANILVAVERKTGDLLWVEGQKRSRLRLVDAGAQSVWRYTVRRHTNK